MSVIARAAAIALIGVLALATTACTGPAPDPTPTTPQTTPAPIFTTDEQALTAAETAYAAYNDANDVIGAAGGVGVEALEPLVDSDLLEQSKEEFAAFETNGLRIIGATGFDGVRLAERSESGGEAHVSMYVCRDVAAVRVVRSDGTDVTPQREDRQPLLVSLASGPTQAETLIVTGIAEWHGDGIC